MDEILLNEQFKSDKFHITINHLLFSKSYRPSVNSISKILEDNGYFGRFKIEVVESKKFGTDILIKIHVYLYDSAFTYTWPHGTFFNIDRKSFGQNRRAPKGIMNNSTVLINCCKILGSMFTPLSRFNSTISMDDALALKTLRVINEKHIQVFDWPEIICEVHDSWGLLPYYKKLIPFLCRIGLISNNKFKIKSKEDSEEFFKNLFDINYWHNI